ncbi:hypothetical protein J6590_005651 [Homalodisca vitripennis]|nr:hypothetical protein J6590_005651 [Homalodisca vitripennis]
MTTAVLMLVCACAVATLAQNRFDSIDIDKVLNSKRLVTNYVQCMVGERPCPPEGADLKKVLPEAIRTKCAKCSDAQRDKAIKVIRKLRQDYPAEWKLITDKWDPKGLLMKEFEQEIAKRKQG